MLDQACEISDWIKTRLMKNGFNAVWIGKKALHLPQIDLIGCPIAGALSPSVVR